MTDIRTVAQDIFWIGASDRRIERFENIFPLTDGVSYNSKLTILYRYFTLLLRPREGLRCGKRPKRRQGLPKRPLVFGI